MSAGEWLRIGDSLYALRAEGSSSEWTDPSRVRMASEAYRQALTDSAWEQEAGVRLLEALYFEGCYTYDSSELRLRVFGEAKDLGARLVSRYPDDARLVYWWLVNLSLWAKESGPLSAIRQGVAEQVRAAGEAMIGRGGPWVSKAYQILGRAHQVLPRIPFLLPWPDKKIAETYLKKAYMLDTADWANPLFLAELYRDTQRPWQALHILEQNLSRKPRPESLVEDRRYLRKMQVMAEDLRMHLRLVAATE